MPPPNDLLRARIAAWAVLAPENQALVDARLDADIAATLPPETVIRPHCIDGGSVMAAFGGQPGAQIMGALRSQAASNPVVRECLVLLDGGRFDVGDYATRKGLDDEVPLFDALATFAGLAPLTGASIVATLKSLAEHPVQASVTAVSAALNGDA